MADTTIEESTGTTLLATFYVKDALCALDASEVQEVIRLSSVTPVHRAPAEVAGVINLRGKIVTLLDLGLILRFGKLEPSRDSRVLIVEDRNEQLGLLVDRVGDVVEVEAEDEEPLPANIPAARAKFLRGVWRSGDHVLALLRVSELIQEVRLT